MSAQNPYERRRDPERRPGTMMAESAFVDSMRLGGPREYLLRLDDVEALVESAVARARAEMRGRVEHEILNSRREAWEEGRVAGRGDGAGEVLNRIDRAFGARVRAHCDLLTALLAQVGEFGGGPAKDLRAAVQESERLLVALIEAHHRGFVPPMMGIEVGFDRPSFTGTAADIDPALRADLGLDSR